MHHATAHQRHPAQASLRHTPRPHGLRLALGSAVLAAALLGLGCASGPPAPNSEIAVADAALSNAISAGAPELAAVEMRGARDKLARAKLALAAEDHTLALRLAEQSLAEAQLAASKAESAKARKAASELQESIRVLREELDRRARP